VFLSGSIFFKLVLNLHFVLADTLISLAVFVMAALMVLNADHITQKYIFAIYSSTVFQREIAGL
jgi:hypothetical protein